MIDKQTRKWICKVTGSTTLSFHPVSGGCINNTFLATSETDSKFFIKANSQTPHDFFKAEAEGLKLLSRTNALRIPKVIDCNNNAICLEYIDSSAKDQSYWRKLAQGLLAIHNTTSDKFGLATNNYCGSTPQLNSQMENGYYFFAENRIKYQVKMGVDNKLLSKDDVVAIDKVLNRIEDIVPYQSASLLHGDLWGGNIFTDEKGMPVLIDPAVYYGWPETDLAMTKLFGGFSPEFYNAYFEAAKLEQGFEDRVDIYNLYHLLNHLNLFGTVYLGQVRTAYRKYL